MRKTRPRPLLGLLLQEKRGSQDATPRGQTTTEQFGRCSGHRHKGRLSNGSGEEEGKCIQLHGILDNYN